ncbi:hypothetical protein [Nesterenkonia sp. CF4.4]|uniref:hypothetical protein n=1 Tax=Nesterenkonia sp. CF4.4 TaxID=3373079 RepID=UPI003EE64EAA
MDSRFPAHYLMDRRVLRTSAPAFRQFVLGTAWSVSNMTDGAIPYEDLPLVTFSSTDSAAELVKLGLWNTTKDGYQIADFQKYQTSAAVAEAVLENRRKADRERQARKRSKEKEDQEPTESQGQSRDGHVTSEGEETQEQGEEDLGAGSSEEVDTQTGEITSTSDSAPISPPDARVSNATSPDDGRISDQGKSPGPSELWGDPPTSSDGDGPRTFDFNTFRNPEMNWEESA